MSNHTPIQQMNLDFVISVLSEVENAKTGATKAQSKANIEKLVNGLSANGFYTQVRPSGDSQSNLLVFVKLASYKYAEEIEKDLIKNYEYGVTAKNDSPAEKLRIIANVLTSPSSVGGVGITVGKGDWSFVQSITPITDSLKQSTFVEDFQAHVTNGDVSTNTIKEKFGVQIALYFEFLKFYTLWLGYLSVFGLVSYFKSKKSFLLTYTFINLIWGCLFITFWNRRQQYLVNFWGVQNSHYIEEHISALAKLNEKFEEKSTYEKKGNTSGIRFVKQLAFIPIALLFVGILIGYQLGCFALEIFLSEIYDGPGKAFLTLLPTILISVFVPILTIGYGIVTDHVLAWENHDNEYSRDNSIIVKQFVLNFLTSYGPLIITSFIYLPFAHLVQPHIGDIQYSISKNLNHDRFYHKYLTNLKRSEDFKINQQRLNVQFFYFIVTNQVIQIVLKYVLPVVLQKGIKFFKTKIQGKPDYKVDDREIEKSWLDIVRNATQLPEYNVNDDFRGLTLQYGYLIIFGPVWSLAPIISIIFNIITFKLDMFKLSNGKYFKPPIPHRVDSIHPWDHALFALTWIGSIISPVITAFYHHGTQPPKTLGQFALDKASVNISGTTLIFLVFLSEHLFFVFWVVLFKISKLFKSEVERKNDFGANDLKIRHDYYSSKVEQTAVAGNDGEWSNFGPERALKEAVAIPIANVRVDKTEDLSEKPAGTSSSKNATTSGNVETLRGSSNNYLTSYQKQNNDLFVSGSRVVGDNRSNPTTSGIDSGIVPGAASAGAVAASAGAANGGTGSRSIGSSVGASDDAKQQLIEEKRRLLEEKERILREKGAHSKNLTGDEKKVLEAVKDKSDSIVELKDSKGNTTYSTMDSNQHFNPSELENEKTNLETSKGTTAGVNNASQVGSVEAGQSQIGGVKGDQSDNLESNGASGTNGAKIGSADADTSEADISQADTTQADTTFESSTTNSNSFLKNAQKTAKDITQKVDENVSNGNVTRKKTSLKKLLRKKK
ncbi:uncharacterized protein AC631_00563 [Debaryomyces fabryi]|uniref:Increased sodium tolerance protein 2 n=1 Tax=Debaryomyces fabryi TaxID=58627 RepID=A0A0V1Q5K4_9ASCO|nr:uncharacterized protein AC631_00563 [Debaryomyces fabryi]KSA03751.1 hypothetical protein AC631_00563 [Debaryomyces fabryi]CUM53280.1 unnamed protein product [Debaryomyces fabryi]